MNNLYIEEKVKNEKGYNQNQQAAINNILEVKNLTKKFGTKLILDNISMSIERGKITVIIGPSGCGKTVFLKHLIALLRPTDGEIYFNGNRIDNLDEKKLNRIRTHYGFLFQAGALFDSLNVSENILFPIRQHFKKTKQEQLQELVKSKLAMVGMDGFQNYFPSSLSGGQKKRVALARAIAMNPQIILYDEPTTGLDPIRSDIINELMLKLQRELNVTSIVVTHDMTSAYKIADRIIMFHEGKIIANGNAEHIREHPHPVVQQFINGKVDENELAILRMQSSISQTQFLPRDFEC